MKKIKLGMLFFMVLLLCTACNGTVTRNIRHAGFTISGTFTCDNFYAQSKDDTNYEKIRYFTNSFLISEEGKIYELSLNQFFANNQNCKEADTSLRVKAILDNKVIKATDNKYYYLVAQNNVQSYTEIPQTDNSYTIYDILLKEEDVVKVMTADSSAGLYYVLKTDGNIYGNNITSVDRNSPPMLTSTQIIYDKTDYGSSIIDFNYAGDSLNTFIKTEEKVFRMRPTNSSECSKYADVACQYEISEDPIFAQYSDRIISFNGSVLITDYQQMFNVAF